MAKQRVNLFEGPNWEHFEVSRPNRKAPNKTIKEQLTIKKPFKLRFSRQGVKTITVYCYESLIKKWGDKVCLDFAEVNKTSDSFGLCLLFSKNGIPDKRSNKFSLKGTTAPRVTWSREEWDFPWKSGGHYETEIMSSYTEDGVTEVQIIFKEEET